MCRVLKHLNHITKMQYLPRIGMASGVGGMVSPTINKNITRANKIVVSKFTFSPLSTGKKKPRKEIRKIRKHGAIRLMM